MTTTLKSIPSFSLVEDNVIKEHHVRYGSIGSILLSVRNDIKNLTKQADYEDIQLTLNNTLFRGTECYEIRFRNHVLRVTLHSYKPVGRLELSISKPDSAKQFALLRHSLNQNVTGSYASAIDKFFMSVFKRSSANALMQVDEDIDSWTTCYCDAKHRSTVVIDFYQIQEELT